MTGVNDTRMNAASAGVPRGAEGLPRAERRRFGGSFGALRDFLLRGGRLTKVAGSVASYAPALGRIGPAFLTASSALAVSAAGAAFLGLSAGQALGACTQTGAAEFTCTGTIGASQSLTASGADVLSVSVMGSATASASSGSAFVLSSTATRGVEFVQEAGSGTISGAASGVEVLNAGGGRISIRASGGISGHGSATGNAGIRAVNDASGAGLSISVGATGSVTGRHGIYARNDGTGSVSISAAGLVRGSGGHGISVYGSGSGAQISVSGSVEGSRGINVVHRGRGTIAVTVSGTVTARGSSGDAAISLDTGYPTSARVTLESGAVVQTSGGNALRKHAFLDGSGRTTLTINTGAFLSGRVDLGGGDDSFILDGGRFEGEIAGGRGGNTAQFKPGATANASGLSGFDIITIDSGATVNFTGTTLWTGYLDLKGVLNLNNNASNSVLLRAGTKITDPAGVFFGSGTISLEFSPMTAFGDRLHLGAVQGQTTLDVRLDGRPGARAFDVIHASDARQDSFVLSEASARIFELRFSASTDSNGGIFYLRSHGCYEYQDAHLSGVFTCNGRITDAHARAPFASGSELLDVRIQESATVSATAGDALTLSGTDQGVKLVQRGAGGTIFGAGSGIDITSSGGAVSVTLTGHVIGRGTGSDHAGLRVTASGGDIIAEVASVTGGGDGIWLDNTDAGSGNISLNVVSGHVAGGSGRAAIRTDAGAGGSSNVVIGRTATVAGGISLGAGNDSLQVSGGVLDVSLSGGSGTDALAFNAGAWGRAISMGGFETLSVESGATVNIRGNVEGLNALKLHGTLDLRDGVVRTVSVNGSGPSGIGGVGRNGTFTGNFGSNGRLVIDVDLLSGDGDLIVINGTATGQMPSIYFNVRGALALGRAGIIVTGQSSATITGLDTATVELIRGAGFSDASGLSGIGNSSSVRFGVQFDAGTYYLVAFAENDGVCTHRGSGVYECTGVFYDPMNSRTTLSASGDNTLSVTFDKDAMVATSGTGVHLTSTGRGGIFFNQEEATDPPAASIVSSASTAIYVNNAGGGSVDIRTKNFTIGRGTGTFTLATPTGASNLYTVAEHAAIFAIDRGGNPSTGITITTGPGHIVGAQRGIAARTIEIAGGNFNPGGGPVTITATGSVTGRAGTAIFARAARGSVTIDTGTGSIIGGGRAAIYAATTGSRNQDRSIWITTRGTVTANRVDGNGVYNAVGILAEAGSWDDIPVTVNVASGTVMGGTGMHLVSAGRRFTSVMPVTVIAAGDAIGKATEGSGIHVELRRTLARQAASLTLSGQVSGGASGTAILVEFPGNVTTRPNTRGGDVSIVLNSGARIGAAGRTAIRERYGNTSLTVNVGASVSGTVDLGGELDGGDDHEAQNKISQRGDDYISIAGSVTGRLVGGIDSGGLGGDRLVVRSGGNVAARIEGFEFVTVQSGGTLTVSGGFFDEGCESWNRFVACREEVVEALTVSGLVSFVDGSATTIRFRELVGGGEVVLDADFYDQESDSLSLETSGSVSGVINLSINPLGSLVGELEVFRGRVSDSVTGNTLQLTSAASADYNLRYETFTQNSSLMGRFFVSQYGCIPQNKGGAFICRGTLTTPRTVVHTSRTIQNNRSSRMAVTFESGATIMVPQSHDPDGPALTVIGSTAGGVSVTQRGSANADVLVSDGGGLFVDSHSGGSVEIDIEGRIRQTLESGRTGPAAIRAYVGTSGTDLTVTAGQIRSGHGGILVKNSGTGDIAVNIRGLIDAGRLGAGPLGAGLIGGDGIRAEGSGGDLSISLGTPGMVFRGEDKGIYASNAGSGSLTIIADGNVWLPQGGTRSNPTSEGIVAVTSSGTDLRIVAKGSVTAALTGIRAQSAGSGSLTIHTFDTVVGSFTRRLIFEESRGIDARVLGSGTDLSVIAAGNVFGLHHGIRAINAGSGTLVVRASGTVEASDADGVGIWAHTGLRALDDSSDEMTIVAERAVGRTRGIEAYHRGSGTLTIRAQQAGAVGVTTDDGIYANRYHRTIAPTTVIVVGTGGEVYGKDRGIYLKHSSRTGIGGIGLDHGVASITVSGRVWTSTTGSAAIELQTRPGGRVAITLESGARVGAANTYAIDEDSADAVVIVREGATVIGNMKLGAGDDTVYFEPGTFANFTVGGVTLDGEEERDALLTRGRGDRLVLNVGSADITNVDLRNWEGVEIGEKSSLTFAGSMTFSKDKIGTGLADADTRQPLGLSLSGTLSAGGNGTRDFLKIRGSVEGGGTIVMNANMLPPGDFDKIGGRRFDPILITGDASNAVINVITLPSDEDKVSASLTLQRPEVIEGVITVEGEANSDSFASIGAARLMRGDEEVIYVLKYAAERKQFDLVRFFTIGCVETPEEGSGVFVCSGTAPIGVPQELRATGSDKPLRVTLNSETPIESYASGFVLTQFDGAGITFTQSATGQRIVAGGDAINARAWGGAVSISVNGSITARATGIWARNDASGKAIEITAGSVTARETGIYVDNRGTEMTSISVSGPVTSTAGRGIWLQLAKQAGYVSITASSSVTGAVAAVVVDAPGSGTVSVNLSERVSATSAQAVYVYGGSGTVSLAASEVSGSQVASPPSMSGELVRAALPFRRARSLRMKIERGFLCSIPEAESPASPFQA